VAEAAQSIVIVGAGQCGGQAADALLRAGYQGRITLIGEEPHPPYQRPPLSKQLLSGSFDRERTFLRPVDYWAGKGVELRTGQRVDSLDLAASRVRLADGSCVDYERALLATGARPRQLDLERRELAGIHDLRTIEHAEAIREALSPGARLVVVGGGFIGLEVAAVAIGLGASVTVLEAAPRLLSRVLPPMLSQWYLDLHRERGVDIRLGVSVSGFEGRDGRVGGVLTDGGTVPADLVVMGVGVVPNQELAAQAGLVCDDGIEVDERCATSHDEVFAAGDCTRHPQPLLGGRLRLESVHNATAQARVAAANLLGGDVRYAEIPWFWSDQYDVKLQMVGLSADHDQAVVRGELGDRSFTVFYLRDGVLIAADAVNSSRDFMACRKLVPRLERVDPARLADPGVPVQDLV
jgi:3-phenylpropionate/trans-cinnamate dioxygenase ferredoxin reductase subunit